jgi:predicted GNAT family acetyltransferase
MAVETDEITLEDGPSKGRYVYRGDDGSAEMTFSRVNAKLIIIDHTEVEPALRGTGAGQALVLRAVEDARAAGANTGSKILPLCPFAAAQFRRHPEWADVLNQRPAAS